MLARWPGRAVAWEVTALEEELLLVQEDRDAFQAQVPLLCPVMLCQLIYGFHDLSHSRATSSESADPATPDSTERYRAQD